MKSQKVTDTKPQVRLNRSKKVSSGSKQNFLIPTAILLSITILGIGLFLFAKKSGLLSDSETKTTIAEQPISAEVQTEINILLQTHRDLSPMIGSYPPTIPPGSDRGAVESLFLTVTSAREKFISEKAATLNNRERYELYVLLGDLFRLGHNLDLEGSWEKSEFYLLQAIDIQPGRFEAKDTLGVLYVNTGPPYTEEAEAIFIELLQTELSDEYRVHVLQGLFFAHYYQLEIDLAIEALDKSLAIDPTNEKSAAMKKMAIGSRYYDASGNEK